mgnify:CR=1 FL=1
MAGQPKKRALFASIEAMAEIASRETDDEVTSAQFVWQWVADGGTVSTLAEELGLARAFVSRKLNGVDEFRQALDEGRRVRADAMADEALEIADNLVGPDLTTTHVAAAREQINVRKWMTGVYDAARFAPKGDVITVNVGDLHLDALRQMRNVTPAIVAIEGDVDE